MFSQSLYSLGGASTLRRLFNFCPRRGLGVVLLLLLGLLPMLAQAQSWSGAGSLTTARLEHSSTLLPNGKVLVVGGSGGIGAGASAELYDPASGQWTATGALITARRSHSATLLPNGKVLVVGGFNGGYLASAELYDPASGQWTATGALNAARAAHSATLLPNGKVLIAGGWNSSGSLASVELYDPATGLWTATGVLNTSRGSHSATLLPTGNVLVVGGDHSDGSILASAELYDPATGLWIAAGALNAARKYHRAILLPNGKVLISGGSGVGSIAGTELYDPASGQWTTTGALNTARYLHTATLLPNGKVLVVGGDGNDGISASAELYDPASGQWTTTGALNTVRYCHSATLLPNGKVLVSGGHGLGADLASAELYEPAAPSNWSIAASLGTASESHAATLLPSGKVFVIGGYEGIVSNRKIARTELFDPAVNTWSSAANLTTARTGSSATLLPSGKVLVAGGINDTVLASAELYDPATNTWSSAGSLASARLDHRATLLPNGKVLVAGGSNSGGYLVSAELYDPTSNTWSTAAPLANARTAHSATLLPSGKVLVVGGEGGYGALASAELYDPVSNTWSPAASLISSRESHGATLLSSGKVLVVGGWGDHDYRASAEVYDPATNVWSGAGALTTARFLHTATKLASGKVLVVGGQGTSGHLASAELYDPVSNTWSSAGSLSSMRARHSATLLLSGKLLVAGGRGLGTLTSAELYAVDQGFADSARPVVSTATSPLNPALSTTLHIEGSGFTGSKVGGSEASSGNTQNSATNYPLLQLMRADNGQSLWLNPASTATRSDTAADFALPSNLARGYYRLTAYVNAIPSEAKMIQVDPGYTVTPSTDGHGTVSPGAGRVEEGNRMVYRFTADTGYALTSVGGTCGGSLSGNDFTTSAITADCTVVGNFTLLSYAISTTASPAAGGTLSCTPNPVGYGGSATCSATPSTGYRFTGFSGDCSGTTCSLSNVTATKSVAANFLLTGASGNAGNGTVNATLSGGGSTCAFSNPSFVPVTGAAKSPPNLPSGVSFPYGLFDFSTSACSAGGTVTVTLTYPQALPAGSSYWKYGPTADNRTPHWYTIPATISGNTVSFSITDGGLGDDDLDASNGVIVDQGGAGVSASVSTTAVPTLREWALLLLAGLVGILGMCSRWHA